MPAPPPNSMMYLATRDDRQGALRLGCHLALLLAAGVAVAWAPGWWLLPAQLVLGMLLAALFAPFHETSHYTAFASRRTNQIVGWLVALPGLHSWPMYQAFHRQHHLYTHDPERDPELLAPEPSGPWSYALRVSGFTYWRTRLGWLWDGLRGDVSAHRFIPNGQQANMVRALRLQLALTLAVIGLVTATAGGEALVRFWLVPALLGQVPLRMYLLTEHTGLPHVRDGLANTRTTLTTALLRLVMWNMPYHAEHHLYPFIPFHQLPAAHGVLRGQLQAVQPGYGRWQWGYLTSLLRKTA